MRASNYIVQLTKHPWCYLWFCEFVFFPMFFSTVSYSAELFLAVSSSLLYIVWRMQQINYAERISSSCESCFAYAAARGRVPCDCTGERFDFIARYVRCIRLFSPRVNFVPTHTHLYPAAARRSACRNPRARIQYHLRISSKRPNKWLCTWDVVAHRNTVETLKGQIGWNTKPFLAPI